MIFPKQRRSSQIIFKVRIAIVDLSQPHTIVKYYSIDLPANVNNGMRLLPQLLLRITDIEGHDAYANPVQRVYISILSTCFFIFSFLPTPCPWSGLFFFKPPFLLFFFLFQSTAAYHAVLAQDLHVTSRSYNLAFLACRRFFICFDSPFRVPIFNPSFKTHPTA